MLCFKCLVRFICYSLRLLFIPLKDFIWFSSDDNMDRKREDVIEKTKKEADARAQDDQEKKKKDEEDEKAKEMQKQQDKSKPVSSTPVPGTPW